MGAGELVYWQAQALDEPFGDFFDDYRTSVVAALLQSIINIITGNRDGDPLKMARWFPWHERPETPEELNARIKRELLGG